MNPNKIDKALDTTIDVLYNQASVVIEQARETAYRQINEALVKRNWELGRLISEEELNGQNRAVYGANIIVKLSKRLTARFGKGFSRRDLYNYLCFYKLYINLFSSKDGIVYSLSTQFHILLSWTHYRTLLQELNKDAREWYEREAGEHNWSTRTLQRNISSQYYFRLLASQRKDLVEKEMLELTAPLQDIDPMEFIKNPVIGEFLGFTADSSYRESELEQSIIDNLEKFLLEMGKGFAFVARQQHIHTEKEDYFIDLVFYNYILKCFVLIDLKTSKIRHQDVGQMDMYVRMYDELKRGKDDNPTIGILLCDDTDEDIARYSVLHDNDQLFASKYMLYLPTPEQLRAEIERQKAIYFLKEKTHDNNDE
ncbi:MAG: PDDEXK nuclease domain-containing protein [Muribaculaceae bacterium]|nr:PDDEXK nuclease domain-containing protein [Muribaculaceae bacterium]